MTNYIENHAEIAPVETTAFHSETTFHFVIEERDEDNVTIASSHRYADAVQACEHLRFWTGAPKNHTIHIITTETSVQIATTKHVSGSDTLIPREI